MLTRRAFFSKVVAPVVAAPAVLKLGLWMPIRPVRVEPVLRFVWDESSYWERLTEEEVRTDIELLVRILAESTSEFSHYTLAVPEAQAALVLRHDALPYSTTLKVVEPYA